MRVMKEKGGRKKHYYKLYPLGRNASTTIAPGRKKGERLSVNHPLRRLKKKTPTCFTSERKRRTVVKGGESPPFPLHPGRGSGTGEEKRGLFSYIRPRKEERNWVKCPPKGRGGERPAKGMSKKIDFLNPKVEEEGGIGRQKKKGKGITPRAYMKKQK